MHQHAHQHAFTPTLHQSLTIPPAPMETQSSNFNRHLPRGTTRLSFAPVTAFHRAAQKPSRSTKRGRWGAMHVCIAWKIYYNEQLKKMQHKPNSLHRKVTPEYPATSLPDTVQRKESDQPSCIHPNTDSPCGPSAFGNMSDRSETGKAAENFSHFNRSYPSDLYTSSPASCHGHTTRKETLEQPPNLHQKEKLQKETHGGQPVDTTKDLPLRDKSWDQTATPEHDGRHGCRKRQLEFESSFKVKRIKQEIVDHQSDASKTSHTDPPPLSIRHTHPSSHSMPVQHINIGDLSVLYPNSSRCNVTRTPGRLVSYPGAEMHPYQTASWEPMWDIHKTMELHSRKNMLQNYSLNTCKGIRIPHVAQKQKEAFHGFLTPPFYFPLALRQQETVYLRGRELLHSRHQNCHVHHPGYVATSYMGP
ncbi:uncharacterized protein LOC126406676 [Epinephelus moara]|uniref:uncharacterized protein LOC126406676 n=1 Tax=Epinephelus moara TaxID=300413 RepID=UPI00214F4B4A|nr:uncharacterized protein LOC126406676 [Epinephelus moara]